MKWTEILTAVGALAAGLAGCSWIATALWKALFGGEERRANAAVALTGAAKLMVDELQEEVRAARLETKAAREETEELRTLLREMRRLADEEIIQLRAQVAVLKQQNHELRAENTNRRP